MCFVTRRRLKTILTLILLGAILAGLLFSGYATTGNAPSWVRMVSVEIQAACRDAGTQWMVVVCLVSYFIVFVFLERRILPQDSTKITKTADGGQSIEGRGRFSSLAFLAFFRGKSSDVFWLLVFVTLVLLRYAFDYTNAARSLQVVVLLTGIVVGKGVALWARSRGASVESREPVGTAGSLKAQGSRLKLGDSESRHLTPSLSPLSGDTSSGCATLTRSRPLARPSRAFTFG